MARRGENIYKRKDGRYEGRYVIGKNADNRTRFGYVYAASYAEVKARLTERKAAQLPRVKECASRRSEAFGEWLERWLRQDIQPVVRQSTFNNYRNLARHLYHEIGAIPLPGVYTYAVRELPGDALGYTYDGSAYAVTVEITDVDGALTSQVRYEKGEEASERALFVNRYETGELTVAKTVKGDGASRNRAFAFEATLFDANGAPLAGTYPCTWADGSAAGAMENGKITFNLAHGQSLTIHDLPVGATYRVVETEHRGYTPSCTSSEGSIVSGEAHVDYINTRNQSTDIPQTGYGEDLGRYTLLAVCLATALLAGIGRKMLKPARRKGRH